MHRQILTLTFLSFMVLVLASCNSGGPDLVAERRPGSQGREGFCWRNDEGNLVVRVRNQANGDAVKPSMVIVEFLPGGPRSGTTSALPGGSSGTTEFDIPSECFNPDCDFTITIDANNDVPENREDNNTADGRCIG
ncbi:MAG: hypothetical protein CEE38_09875 [Planctomycetes bacterium B3_Pla]|nr:MAG: hypothetical protein CEE38_09875 [Planctomycetes bacterium B3_Pla]